MGITWSCCLGQRPETTRKQRDLAPTPRRGTVTAPGASHAAARPVSSPFSSPPKDIVNLFQGDAFVRTKGSVENPSLGAHGVPLMRIGDDAKRNHKSLLFHGVMNRFHCGDPMDRGVETLAKIINCGYLGTKDEGTPSEHSTDSPLRGMLSDLLKEPALRRLWCENVDIVDPNLYGPMAVVFRRPAETEGPLEYVDNKDIKFYLVPDQESRMRVLEKVSPERQREASRKLKTYDEWNNPNRGGCGVLSRLKTKPTGAGNEGRWTQVAPRSPHSISPSDGRRVVVQRTPPPVQIHNQDECFGDEITKEDYNRGFALARAFNTAAQSGTSLEQMNARIKLHQFMHSHPEFVRDNPLMVPAGDSWFSKAYLPDSPHEAKREDGTT